MGNKKSIRELLVDIYNNEIIKGEQYRLRTEINDGGENSYIGFNLDISSYPANIKKIQVIRVYRHTNDVSLIKNCWEFHLGNVIHKLDDNSEIPIEFRTYGKSCEEAENEAFGYISKIKSLIRKHNSKVRQQLTNNKEKERQELKRRLAELESEEE
jgi:hypothetical protein